MQKQLLIYQVKYGHFISYDIFRGVRCCYFALGFVQIRYFVNSIKLLFAPSSEESESGELTSFQAFINTLGGNIGNGSLAGIPVAVALGGPGAMFWLLVMSTFAVALRYAEVYLGTVFIGKKRFKSAFKGGPMLYLHVAWWSLFIIRFCLFLFRIRICMWKHFQQCNSVASAVQKNHGTLIRISLQFLLLRLLDMCFLGFAKNCKIIR